MGYYAVIYPISLSEGIARGLLIFGEIFEKCGRNEMILFQFGNESLYSDMNELWRNMIHDLRVKIIIHDWKIGDDCSTFVLQMLNIQKVIIKLQEELSLKNIRCISFIIRIFVILLTISLSNSFLAESTPFYDNVPSPANLLQVVPGQSSSGENPLVNLSRKNDVEDWPMFGRDTCHTGFTNSKAPNSSALLWRCSINGQISSSPVAMDGVIYCASEDNTLYAINAETGVEIWNFTTIGGIYDSPAIVGDDVIISCSYVNTLYAVNRYSGEQTWMVDLYERIISAPVISKGRIFVNSERKLHVLNANTGDEFWNYSASDEIMSIPAINNNRVYFHSRDGEVYSLDEFTGERIWNHSLPQWLNSVPVIGYGKVFINYNGEYLYALNETDNTNGTTNLVWSRPIGTGEGSESRRVSSKIAVGYEKVFVSSSSSGRGNLKMQAFEQENGSEIWNFESYTWHGVYSSPIIADNKLFFWLQ